MRNCHGKINKNSLESLIQKIPIRFMMQRWYEGVAESLLELFQELETRESIGAQKKWTLETLRQVIMWKYSQSFWRHKGFERIFKLQEMFLYEIMQAMRDGNCI